MWCCLVIHVLKTYNYDISDSAWRAHRSSTVLHQELKNRTTHKPDETVERFITKMWLEAKLQIPILSSS